MYSPDGEYVLFGCTDAAGNRAMCVADPDFTEAAILFDQPDVQENHFSWGVAVP